MSDWSVAEGLSFNQLMEIWSQLPPEQRTPEGLWSAIAGYPRQWTVYYADTVELPAPTPEKIFEWVQPDFAPLNIKLPNGTSLDLDVIIPAFPARPNESVSAPSDYAEWIVWIEVQERQIKQACEDLDIDPYHLHEYYASISHEKFLRNAKAARLIKDSGVDTYTLHRLLSRQMPLERGAGRKKESYYDKAWERINIIQSHSQKQAFELMIEEEKTIIGNEFDRQNQWESFRSAMKARSKKYKT